MPELPEMELYRRHLNEKMSGHLIHDVIVNREKTINVPPTTFVNAVKNKTIIKVDRKAKHLVFHLNTGMKLLLHLMLGGWMYFGNEKDSPDRTKQIILSVDHGSLYFIGLRLGYLHLLTETELLGKLNELGPEPLDPSFTEAVFLDHIKKRRGMLKTTLINQKFLSGIGNCYSDEICFEAKLNPTRSFNELTPDEQKSLYNAITSVIQSGIQQGGYMDHPFFSSDELTGNYQTVVYDREGEACERCGNKIVKIEISNRKSFYCPVCQK